MALPDLTSITALVAGAAGAVGEGIARALLEAGADVVVPSRSQDRLDALADRLSDLDAGRLHFVVGDAGEPAAALDLRDRAERAAGPLDLVVASLGGWSQGGRIVDTPPEVWHRTLADNLTSHYACARAFVPVLAGRARATYVFIAGFSGRAPYPGAGPVSAAVAGELMLARVVAEEHRDSGLRVHALVLGPVLTRHRPSGRPGWLAATEVGGVVGHLHAAQRVLGRSVLDIETADRRDALLEELGVPL